MSMGRAPGRGMHSHVRNLIAINAVSVITLFSIALIRNDSDGIDPGGVTSNSSSSVMGDTGEYSTIPDYFVPLQSLEQLVASSDLIAVVSVDGKVGEYWLDSDPELFVHSQFQVQVEESLKGEALAGSKLVIHVPGGTMALVGDPSPGGSFRPEPGDETVLTEYAEFPFPRDGAREIMFLSRITTNDGNTFWMQARPEARFAIADDGTIESVLKASGARGDEFYRWLLGETVTEARERIGTATR